MTMYFVQTTTTATILLCYLVLILASVAPATCAEQQQEAARDRGGGKLDAPPTASSSGEGAEGATRRSYDVHKLMSEQDLRRIFQVDSHDQVPEYEILQLTANSDGSHLISPISDLGDLTRTTTTSTATSGSATTTTSAGQTSEAAPQAAAEAEQSSGRHKRSAAAAAAATASDRDAATEALRQRQAEKTNFDERDLLEQLAATLSGEDAKANQPDKLIVMNLSTFGRDFRLRLKRNADFQQRIKDMKMFMAESTQDGQLRYTEIKATAAAAAATGGVNKQQEQAPHKRAVGADESDEGAPVTQADKTTPAGVAKRHENSTRAAEQQQQPQGDKDANFWNIGSTYHDEDNLAALLIDRDAKTGHLQVDGTIGNDFVIKPMPQATINKLVEQHKLLHGQQQATAAAAASTQPTAKAAEGANSIEPTRSAKQATQDELAAAHLHDDDPHDDDEMFLDEDEALELAHVRRPALAGNQTHKQLPQPQQPKPLSGKAASERKWKKYRKLMAQTQVPKLGSYNSPSYQPVEVSSYSAAPLSSTPTTTAAPAESRARRHAHNQAPTLTMANLETSHHIVYRQRPSSEGSSGEHQHSFMSAPGDQSMDAMALRFGRRLEKRSADDDQQVAGAGQQDLSARSQRLAIDSNNDADSEEDPLGGQFYLEPGLEGALSADWLLIGGGGNTANATLTQRPSRPANSTAPLVSRRFKRNVRGPARSQVRRKRQAPDTVWPEVLLVVDYDSFLLHGGDSRDVKRYFVSFWNGVDLRYKLLVHPHIRISLAGMIVAKDRDATPYLERNRLRAPNADAVDAAGALTDMGKYLYREDRLPTYDLAVVITKLDMCRRRYEGGRCNRGTAGFAYVGGACVVNKRLEKVNSVAIIEDSGGFSGIIVAAHEVGHLLGCVHDGSPPPSYLGGPGATHCPWEDGFIMSDLRHTERGFRWSHCSVEQFKHFLNGETATCLYNYPHESQMLHRLLPGTMLSLDEQCKRDRGTNACFKDARVCAQLFCFDSASGYCVSYRPAAEGSPCGEGQVCRNGKCVGEIENIIPDYTHQTQTVVARRAPLVGPSQVGPIPLLPPPPGRLADNGLSASSTLTATSSPDGHLTSSSGAKFASTVAAAAVATTGGGGAQQQVSRRVDVGFQPERARAQRSEQQFNSHLTKRTSAHLPSSPQPQTRKRKHTTQAQVHANANSHARAKQITTEIKWLH